MGKARRRSSRGKAAKREQKSSHKGTKVTREGDGYSRPRVIEDFTAENIAQSNRNHSSEYLPQRERRKVRKGKKRLQLGVLGARARGNLFPDRL